MSYLHCRPYAADRIAGEAGRLPEGTFLRQGTPRASRLGAVPSCAGLMTRLACGYARKSGLDLLPTLRRAGLTLHDIEDETVRLRVTTQIDFLNFLAEALGDRLLGFHVALGMDLRRTGFLYYIAASSDDLGGAMQGLARCSTILNEGIKVETKLSPTFRLGFEYAHVSRLSDRHQIEGWMTAIVRSCREFAGRDLQPISLQIMHQRIAESAELDAFFGRTVEFGTNQDAVAFSAEAAKLPVVNADRHLNRLLIKHCEEMLAHRRGRTGLTQADVENVLAALLPHGGAHIETVAQKLGLSPRTLRRKLAAEGVTFAGILEDLRCGLAKHYLTEQDLSISRIAWLLGYTEVSAFSHAFRRWTGRAPRAARSERRLPAVQMRRTHTHGKQLRGKRRAGG